jgi:hypothetical protein
MTSLQIKPTVFNSIKTPAGDPPGPLGHSQKKKSNAHRVGFEFAKHTNKKKTPK